MNTFVVVVVSVITVVLFISVFICRVIQLVAISLLCGIGVLSCSSNILVSKFSYSLCIYFCCLCALLYFFILERAHYCCLVAYMCDCFDLLSVIVLVHIVVSVGLVS